jgi:hypothetical protein
MDIVYNNMKLFDIHYFSSEMWDLDWNIRLSEFPIDLEDWQFNVYPRQDNFADVIKPGKGKINIIDFIEIYDNFYLIGAEIAKIWSKLDGAIAIIALQKNPEKMTGRGGNITLEKAQLYLSVDDGKIHITKAKYFKHKDINPNRLECDFKLVSGCKFIQESQWGKSDRWGV